MNGYTREQFAKQLGANGDPKLNAAADFAARLLNSSVGDSVARIVLYGSVARGEAKPDSDIDLLLVGLDDLGTLLEHAQDIRYDMLLEGSDYISPMVYGVTEAAYPSTWFLHNSLKLGREVYRMDDKELRRKEAQGWWVLAKEYLGQAERAGKNEDYRLAVDGAYNAGELAVKGLLALRVDRLPTSHSGLVQVFSREYVVTGVVDRKTGHELSTGLELRGRARYSREANIIGEHVSQITALAKQLIDLLENALSDLEKQSGSRY